MKKYFYFLLILSLFTSCEEDVKFNNPAFQALKNNAFWRAQTYKAYFGANGNIIVEGSLGYENIILQTESSSEEVYTLGIDDVSKASYKNTLTNESLSFSTGTNRGSGQIVITDYDAEKHIISGTFRFTAVNDDETDSENTKLNFTEGVFYKVPIEVNDIIDHQ